MSPPPHLLSLPLSPSPHLHRAPQAQAKQQQAVIQHILATVGAECREELIDLLQSPPEVQATKVRVAAPLFAIASWVDD